MEKGLVKLVTHSEVTWTLSGVS